MLKAVKNDFKNSRHDLKNIVLAAHRNVKSRKVFNIIPPSPAGAMARSFKVTLFLATLVTVCLLSSANVRITGLYGICFNVAKRIAVVPQSLDTKSEAMISEIKQFR